MKPTKIITIILFLCFGTVVFPNEVKQVPKKSIKLIKYTEKLTNAIIENAFDYYCKPFVEIFTMGAADYIFTIGPQKIYIAAENYYENNFKYQKKSDYYIFAGELLNNKIAYPENAALSSDKIFILVFRGYLDKLPSGHPFNYCYFQIYKHISKDKYKLDFTSKEKWRIFDFKQFLWEDGKIKVVSGDVGTCFYVRKGNKWVKRYE